jgi:hypothetical protein
MEAPEIMSPLPYLFWIKKEEQEEEERGGILFGNQVENVATHNFVSTTTCCS